MMNKSFQLQINGIRHTVNVDPDRSLLSVLRDELDLTGSKYGCGEGQCGACTVLIDSKPTRSCITHMNQIEGKKITTIEGIATNGNLHPLQEAFLQTDALQCGYCTSGMIMSGVALLNQNQNPTREEAIAFMKGNVCRCGTYDRILAAIKMASGRK
jgi:aerobic-type carbon monoxide dehydrogenase small subunit (CoxS/CutS family)